MNKNQYDVIIIGTGPAGCSAGIYAGRAMLKTLLIDQSEDSGQIHITNEVVNYPGLLSVSGQKLSATMRKQAQNFGAEIITAKVEHVDFKNDLKKVITSDGEFEAVSVIIATGAVPRTLGFRGEKTFRGHGVGYCATCDGEFFAGLDIFVIGGGFAAAEEAVFLTRYAKKVYVIVRGDDFSCAPSVAEKVKQNPQIEVQYNTEITALEGDSIPRKALFVNNKTGENWEYTPEDATSTFGVFVFAGYVPQSEQFKHEVTVDKAGYIPTNEQLQTNCAGVYAAGDIRPKELRQLVTAVADGAIAATNAGRYIEETKKRLGITIEPQEKEEKTSQSSAMEIDEDLAKQLVPFFERFENNVTIHLICKSNDIVSSEAKELLEGIAKLTDKITLHTYLQGNSAAIEKHLRQNMAPAILIENSKNQISNVHYYGVPSGHEFNSFLLALYNVAGPGQQLNPEQFKRAKAITGKKNVRIGMSLNCTMCPDVVQGMQQIAFANNDILVDVIDVAKFPEFKTKYHIMSVPAILIDETLHFGRKSIDELLSELEQD